MNDPEVIKFVNEHSRVAANKLASAYLEAVQHLASFESIKSKVPNDNTPVDDGREAEGISRLVCSDIHILVNVIKSVQASLDANDGYLKNLVFKISTSKGA